MLREVDVKTAAELYEEGRAVCCIVPGVQDPQEWGDYNLVSLKDYLAGIIFLANEETPAEPEKAVKERKSRKKEEVDVGKLYALADGNWPAAKIAEEPKISIATVYRYLDKRGKNNDQN